LRVNGTHAAKSKSNQKIQALTFYQVSPRLLVFAAMPRATAEISQSYSTQIGE